MELFYDDEFALFFFRLLKGMRFTSSSALMSATRKGIFFGCKDEFNCLYLNFSNRSCLGREAEEEIGFGLEGFVVFLSWT